MSPPTTHPQTLRKKATEMLGSASLACMLAVAPMGVGAASVPLNSNQHAAPTSAAVAPAASPQPVVTEIGRAHV